MYEKTIETLKSMIKTIPIPNAAKTQLEKNRALTEAIDCLKKSSQESRWIPLSEREPEEEGLYLVCFDDEYITAVSYVDNDWELWVGSGEPVAWQELPKPYKE